MWHTLEEHPNKKPIVFRYLRQKYIDEFFQSGRLRLSAFSEFAKHTDEQRLDAEEGWAVVELLGEKQILQSSAGTGLDTYILSASFRGDAELMNAFGTDGYFKINDVKNFKVAVAARLMGCAESLSRSCIYVDRREIIRTIGAELDMAVKKNEQGKINLMRVVPLIQKALWPEAYFQKLKRYAPQQEYRFMWYMGHAVHEPLFVECPEALQFCERIT